jgi:hypothetical protein
MIRMAAGGAVQRVVAWSPSDECGLNMSSKYKYCARLLADVAQDGSRVAFVTMNTRGSEAGTYRVVVIGAKGDTVFSRQYPFSPVAIPHEVSDSLAALAVKEPPLPALLGMGQQAPLPTVYPPVNRVIIGQDGTVWLELRTTNGRKPYIVLDAKGNPRGAVSMPISASILVASLKTIWTVEKDADDLDSVVRYQVNDRR